MRGGVACLQSDFKTPIEGFKKATEGASVAFNDYANALDNYQYEQNISDLVAKRAKLVVPPEDCDPESKTAKKQCRLFVSTPSGPQPVKSSIAPHARRIMTGLVLYAGHLEAITKAETAAQIKSAVDGAKANVTELAKAVDALNAQLGRKTALEPQLASIAGPIANILTFALTKYAEHIKLDALRDATARMDVAFPDIVELFATIAERNNRTRRSHAFAVFQRARAEFGANPSKQSLQDLQEAAAALDVTLAAKPAEVFYKLSKLHNELTNALNSPEPNFETVFAIVQQILNEASQLAADAKALEAALNPKPKK
jgi:hypothetical protein